MKIDVFNSCELEFKQLHNILYLNFECMNDINNNLKQVEKKELDINQVHIILNNIIILDKLVENGFKQLVNSYYKLYNVTVTIDPTCYDFYYEQVKYMLMLEDATTLKQVNQITVNLINSSE